MNVIIDKFILYICCSIFLLFLHPSISFLLVAAFLTAPCFSLAASCLAYDTYIFRRFSENPLFHLLLVPYFLLCLWQPLFCYYLPLLFYDVFYTKNIPLYLLGSAALLVGIQGRLPLILLLLTAFAALLYLRSAKIADLKIQLNQLRDSSMEHSLLLSRRNRDLLEKQDYEIHLATLKERNRIAREIHDNVGHMLSRSILQVGALTAVNKQEPLAPALDALKDTLSGAMDSIRSSVHDLHDDSIELKSAVTGMLSEYTGYRISFDYDIGENVPRNVKYCYISVIKEALSNIVKHSNATSVWIVMREHPSLYQLSIRDNGSDIVVHTSGIGLQNMQERVNTFHGTFSYNTEHGFAIFISIPKDSLTDE